MKHVFNADSLRIALIATVIAVAGFWATYQFVEPAPPKTLTIASGSTSGAYYAFAGRYAAILAQEGITLTVDSTDRGAAPRGPPPMNNDKPGEKQDGW